MSELKSKRRIITKKLDEAILNNEALNKDIELLLPSNYNFEVHATIRRIRQIEAKRVALQMAEGLILFAQALTFILSKHGYDDDVDLLVEVLEDPSYGACCVEDTSCASKGFDLLVHYGHSCLIPVSEMKLKVQYVMVSIQIDVKHFLDSLLANFRPGTSMAMVATVQFVSVLQAVKSELSETFRVFVPKVAPLAYGEILGCTAPKIEEDVDCLVYLGDGRFHLESVMIANPEMAAYQYSPYAKTLTLEKYDHDSMRRQRLEAINSAKSASKFGLIHGTLGNQGSNKVLTELERLLEQRGVAYEVIPMSEIDPADLEAHADCDAFIQNSCPRLSIDWGHSMGRPFLSPYEAAVLLGAAQWLPDGRYPADFYAHDSLGPWTPNHRPPGQGPARRRNIVIGATPLPTQLTQLSMSDPQPPLAIKDVNGAVCDEHEWRECPNCGCRGSSSKTDPQ